MGPFTRRSTSSIPLPTRPTGVRRSFRSESSAMVAKMDRAKGAQREGMLNALRSRKNAEQPIKSEFYASRAALLKTFPPEMLAGGGPEEQQPGPIEEVMQGREIILQIPKLAENQVLFISSLVS